MGQFIQLILAIPKILGLVKDILDWFSAHQKKQIEEKHSQAKSALELAKTEEEIKDATRKMANNP